MTIRTRTLAGLLAAHLPLAAWRVTAPLRRIARRWRARRAEARALADIERLDAIALRDMALARSELGSVHAEARAGAECTRRRIASLRA
jgi:hypothetical protein